MKLFGTILLPEVFIPVLVSILFYTGWEPIITIIGSLLAMQLVWRLVIVASMVYAKHHVSDLSWTPKESVHILWVIVMGFLIPLSMFLLLLTSIPLLITYIVCYVLLGVIRKYAIDMLLTELHFENELEDRLGL